MKLIIILLSLCFHALIPLETAYASESDERTTVRAEATQAYRSGDFASLERQHSTYSNFMTQRTSSGAFRMTLFFDGIAGAKRDFSESQLQSDIARTQVWVNEHKDSPIAYVLHAYALQSYGEYFRGNGFANTVPPQAWKVYEQYIEQAGRYLIENESIASRSSTWYAWMLIIARTAAWPEPVVLRLFEEGLKRDPYDFRLYVNATDYLLPKWHGTPEALDTFIRFAVTKAPPDYGPELYARLYSGAGEGQFGRRLYADSLIDWSKMKEGLELWYKRFPTSWNKNIVAYHACIAGDKRLAKPLLDEIGHQPRWQIWQPRAEATFDTCVRWAADPAAEPKEPKEPKATPADEGKQTRRDTAQSAA